MNRADGPDEIPISWIRFSLTVFLPFATGYFLSYLFRSVNAVIAPDLTQELDLRAADLGFLTATYFLSFAAFQLPLGVLLDRFGPRRVQSGLLIVAASGATCFALGADLTTLAMGRALIGVGVSGALMSSFKAITIWSPPRRWPLIQASFMAAGGLGALTATAPVEASLRWMDWRGLFAGLAIAALAAAAAIFFVTPDRRTGETPTPVRAAFAGFRQIFRDDLFWRFAPVAVTVFAAGMSIQGLWAGPWLRDVAGLDRAAVASGLLTIAVAMTIGFVLTGVLADALQRRGIGLVRVMAAGVLAFLVAQGLLVFHVAPGAPWTLAFFGLFCNFPVLSYAVLSRHFPLNYVGRVNTALNLLVFVGAFLCQFAMGAVLDLWPAEEARTYAPEGYRLAFGGILLLEVLGWLWLLRPTPQRTPKPR